LRDGGGRELLRELDGQVEKTPGTTAKLSEMLNQTKRMIMKLGRNFSKRS